MVTSLSFGFCFDGCLCEGVLGVFLGGEKGGYFFLDWAFGWEVAVCFKGLGGGIMYMDGTLCNMDQRRNAWTMMKMMGIM